MTSAIPAELRARQPILRERLRIGTPGATLDAELAYPAEATPSFAALLVNPHPHMGGSMQNNVIAALSQQLAQAGGATLRFDYRGVGRSDGAPVDVHESLAEFWRTGHAPQDPLMFDDTRAAAGWMARELDAPLVMIGYSFGCYAAAKTLCDHADQRRRTAGLALISPTLDRHDFDRLPDLAVPTLVIYSDNDFATPAARTSQWASQVWQAALTRCFSGAEHFYRGVEDEVATACVDFIEGTILGREAR